MARFYPFLAAVLLCFVSLSCSDETTTTPTDTVNLSGVVRSGTSAEPMADAEIVALTSDNGAEVARTTSSSDGSFTLLNVPRVTVDLLIQKPGYLTQRLEDIDPVAELDPESTGVNVRMIPDSGGCCNGVLTLTAKDQNGVGIQGVLVLIRKNEQIIEDPRTNANGVVTVDNLCPGVYSLRLSREGYRTYEATFTINEACEPVSLTAVMETVQICCTGVMTLTVKTPDAVGIPGATVHLWKGGGIIRTATTNANGVVVFDSLCTGSYGVDVSKDGYESRELTFSIGEDCGPVERSVVLEAPACCSGVFTLVVRDNANNPIVGARVVIKRNGVVVRDLLTNSTGTIETDGLCQGEFSYRVSKEGWQAIEGGFAINSACDPVSRSAVMEQTQQVCCNGVFTLIVRDANGNPVQGARVIVYKNDVAVEDPITNASGGIGIDGMCAGEYTYRISKEGWQAVEGSFVINTTCDPVAREATLIQNPVVCCTGVLTLFVRDSNQTAIPGARVIIKKNGVPIEDPVTDSNGRIIVDGLCAGSYTWSISTDRFEVNEGSFLINENCDPVVTNANLTAVYVCCSGELTVTVVDGANQPIADATVKLWRNGAVIATKTTNSAGVAEFGDLCRGEYGVDVLKTGFNSREFGFAIGEGCPPHNKTVELTP